MCVCVCVYVGLNFRDWSQLQNYFNSEIFPIYGSRVINLSLVHFLWLMKTDSTHGTNSSTHKTNSSSVHWGGFLSSSLDLCTLVFLLVLPTVTVT